MGIVHPKDAFLLRTHVGEADNGASKLEMSLVNGHLPAVKSLATGKTFVLNWQDIIELAIKAGLEEKDA